MDTQLDLNFTILSLMNRSEEVRYFNYERLYEKQKNK